MRRDVIAAGMAALVQLAVSLPAVAQTAAAEPKKAPSDATDEASGPSEGSASFDLDELLDAATEEEAPEAAAASAAGQADSPQQRSTEASSDKTVPVITLPSADTAEAPAPQTRPRRPQAEVEEIIVTAQRREQSVQDVPISITVLDPRQLSNANITNSSDLATYTPSLSTNQRFGSETATFAIRGFTQELRTTASVATYFAEVVAPRGQSSQTSGDGAGPGTLFDLQNVQVLKGPQGTLFGRNTTGGAILIVPRRPTDALEGHVEASGGDFGMRRIQAVANIPVTDGFRLRAGVDDNRRQGYLDNITGIGAAELGNVNYTAARLSAVVDVADALENYTIFSYVDSDTNGYTRQLFACNPGATPDVNPFFVFTGPPCQQQLASQSASGQDGFYDIVSTVPEALSVIEEKRAINTLTWQIGDELRLKNILAYAHLHTENGSDIFGTQFRSPLDPDPRREFKVGISVPNPDIPVTSQETYVGELQLQANMLDGRLQWQTGAYYENSRPDGFSGNNSSGLISCELATLSGDPSGFNCFDPTGGQLGSVLIMELKTRYLNRALYAEATYGFAEQFSVTAGLRYTWDRTEGYGIKRRYAFAGPAPLPPTVTMTSPKVSSQAPTGQIQLSYMPSDEVMAYAKVLRGYRQGSVVLAADPGIDTFEPEQVDTYEVGTKLTLSGVIPGRFNLSVFYNDFTDQQLATGYVSPSSGPTSTIFNAGKSRIQGLEIESFFQLIPSLGLGLSYSYLDTELLEQEDRQSRVAAAAGPVGGATYAPAADVGDELPFAADHTLVASLTYTLPLADSVGRVDLGTTYVYTGKRRSAASSSTPFDVLDPYELLNLNLNWSSMFGSRLDLSVFATNVLDEEYLATTSGSYNSLGFESRALGLPRMLGARMKYRFGD